MSTVITVENLGKKYTLSHQQREPYTALRDVLTDGFRNTGRRLATLFSSSPVPCLQSRSSEEFWALKDVSFEVKQGDRIGIIGRNGAGKSTLLKILSRITEPTTGSVRIKGRVASLLEVGTGFHPELSGRENIFLNGAILGMSRAEIRKKFDEIVDFAEIEKFLDTPVKRYSSGMYVRLAFAVAAHLEPEILVVDEVLAVGDAQFQKKCLGKMKDVSAKEGRTVLFVSHNMPMVQRLCNKAFWLDKGALAATGTSDEMVRQLLGATSQSNFAWVNPASSQNRDALIKGIRLVDDEGVPTNVVCTDGGLRLQFDVEIFKKITNLQLSVGLLDEFNAIIFGSSPLDAGVDNPTEPGCYQLTVTFPEEILLPKTYGIRTVIWTPEGGQIDAFDDIRFQVDETPSLANSTPCGRSGMVAIRCGWSVESQARGWGQP